MYFLLWQSVILTLSWKGVNASFDIEQNFNMMNWLATAKFTMPFGLTTALLVFTKMILVLMSFLHLMKLGFIPSKEKSDIYIESCLRILVSWDIGSVPIWVLSYFLWANVLAEELIRVQSATMGWFLKFLWLHQQPGKYNPSRVSSHQIFPVLSSSLVSGIFPLLLDQSVKQTFLCWTQESR